MKVNYADYIKKTDVSVLVAEAIFSVLHKQEKIKSIGDIAHTSSGGTPLRGNIDFYNGDIPWLKSGELNDGYIDAAEEFITAKGLSNSSAKLFPEGTLLLAMYGATVGKTGITKIKASTNQAVCAIFPKAEVKRDFLYWFLRQHRYKFIEISKGGAQPNISQTVISQTLIPVPNIIVQESIVSVLFSIQKKATIDLDIIPNEYKDAVVKVFHTKQSVTTIESENFKQLDLIKKLRQQILQDAIQGKLVPQDPNDEHASKLLERIKTEKIQLFKEKKVKKDKPLPEIKLEEIPYVIPESWVWCRLGNLIELISGQDLTPSQYSDADNSGIPYITGASNMSKGNVLINRWTENPKSIAIKGDLLLTCKGSGVGKMAYLSVMKAHIARQIMSIRSCFIPMDYIQKIIETNVIFYKKAAKSLIPGIDRETVLKTFFPLPPFAEQKRIIYKMEQLMRLCDELEQTIQLNQKYTQELLQVALKEALEPKTHSSF